MRLFPYSGSKERFIAALRPPPPGTSYLVEPFGGSCAYSLGRGLDVAYAERDPRLRSLFQTARASTFTQWQTGLREIYEAANATEAKEDVRRHGLRDWQLFVLQVCTCGMFRGAANSFSYYPQFRGSLDKSLRALVLAFPDLQRVLFVGSDAQETRRFDTPSACFFVDPPYLRTTGGYADADMNAVRALIGSLRCPAIVTYGDGAAEDLPGLPWEILARRQVPRVRTSGTSDRTEFVAYLNWRSA